MLSRQDSLRPKDLWLIAGFSLLIFFSHAAAYFCWLIVLAMLSIFDSQRFPRFKIFLAGSPSLLLMAIYVLRKDREGPGIAASLPADVLKSKLEFVSIFSPLHFVDPFYWNDPRWLKALATVFNAGAVVVVLILGVVWIRKTHFRSLAVQGGATKGLSAACLVLLAIFLIVPFSAFTRVYDFNGRFLLPVFVFMLAIQNTNGPRLRIRSRWALTLAAAAACTVVLMFQFIYVGGVSHKLRCVYEVLEQAHLGPDAQYLSDTEFEHLDRLAPRSNSGRRLLPVHEPLAYFVQYLRLEQPTCVPLFPTTTSIIRSSIAYHPLFNGDKKMNQYPRSVVILGGQRCNRLIAGLIGAQYKTKVDTDYVLILEHKTELANLLK